MVQLFELLTQSRVKCLLIFLHFLTLIGCTKGDKSFSPNNTNIGILDSLINQSEKLSNKGEIDSAYAILDTIYNLASATDSLSYMNYADFTRGRLYFLQNELDTALFYWLNALKISHKLESEPNAAELLSNIGIIYFDKGYLRTAIEYFVQARKKMELNGDTTQENYQITTINLAAIHLKQEEFSLANEVLRRVKRNKWPTIDFLFFINRALVYYETGKLEDYELDMDSAALYSIKINPYYQSMFEDVKLEYAVKGKSLASLKDIVGNKSHLLDLKDLETEVNFLNANYILDSSYRISKEKIDSLEKASQKEGLIDARLTLYHFLKVYYKKNLDLASFVDASDKYDFWKEKYEERTKSSNLLDFYTLLEMDKNKFENQKLKSLNQIVDLKVKNQLYLNYFLIFMVTTLVLVCYLIFIKLVKEKKDKEQKLAKLGENIVTYKENEIVLKHTIDQQGQKMKEILANVNKIAILRKQLKDFLDYLSSIENITISPKVIKSAQVDLEAFFSNYSDLAIIAAKDQDSIFNQDNLKIRGLSDREIKVMELIQANYTSKEIAILLSKSEKAIEYARRNIRKKLEIETDITISDYLSMVN